MENIKYRVAQWGTGHTGLHSLKKIIEHEGLDLVAVRVHSSAKIGRDAGELCGIPPIGVLATDRLEEIIAAKPDCVLYMPLLDHECVDTLCRLLAAGINIVTTATTFHHPPTLDRKVRGKIEQACELGRSSLYDTGPSPGFISEILPLTALLMERRLDRIGITQFADLADRNSPEFIGRMFGRRPAEIDPGEMIARLERTDGASLRQLADAIGLPLDSVVGSGEPAVAARTVKIPVATIAAGTVGAWRLSVVGTRRGKPLISFCRTMYVTQELDPAWPLAGTGWQVKIDGDAPMEMDIRFPTENYGPISAGYNAHVPVNAVPAVCAAAPGIRTSADLRLVPTFGPGGRG